MDKLYMERDRNALEEIRKELIEPLLNEIDQLFNERSFERPFSELSFNDKTAHLLLLNDIHNQFAELKDKHSEFASMSLKEKDAYVENVIGKENAKFHPYSGDSLPLLYDRPYPSVPVYSGRQLPIPLSYWLSLTVKADALYEYACNKGDEERTPAFSELSVGFKAAYIALLIRSFCIADQYEVQKFVYGGDYPTTKEIDIQGIENHRRVRTGYNIQIRGMAPSNETLLNIGHRIRNVIEPSRVCYMDSAKSKKMEFWKEEPHRRSKRESTERMIEYIEGLEKKPDGRKKDCPSWEDVRVSLEKMGIPYTDKETLKNAYFKAKKRREGESR